MQYKLFAFPDSDQIWLLFDISMLLLFFALPRTHPGELFIFLYWFIFICFYFQIFIRVVLDDLTHSKESRTKSSPGNVQFLLLFIIILFYYYTNLDVSIWQYTNPRGIISRPDSWQSFSDAITHLRWQIYIIIFIEIIKSMLDDCHRNRKQNFFMINRLWHVRNVCPHLSKSKVNREANKCLSHARTQAKMSNQITRILIYIYRNNFI